MTSFQGILRKDGRKGIRNVVCVVYLVECAHHVARLVVSKSQSDRVHLIGFPGCYPNDYSFRVMSQLTTHPNVSGVLLVSLGCEGFNREALEATIRDSGRPVETLVIQSEGGTRRTIEAGLACVHSLLAETEAPMLVPMGIDELMIGTICGGSDGTSGITANPAVGRCFDQLVAERATCIFEETGELIGCEKVMSARAATPEIATEINSVMTKAATYYAAMGYGSFAPGNAEGGLTTQEEKSMGAYSKSGSSAISGILKPGDVPPSDGLFLLDVVPDGEPQFGFPNISDNAEIVELISCGCHLILFTTGRGSVVGSAVSPVIKICANPETYARMPDDMDVNAGDIISDGASISDVGTEIYESVIAVARGRPSISEALGHQEFLLTYKRFDTIGPPCLPQRK